MISVEQYEELLKYARFLVKGTAIDTRDLVHDALVDQRTKSIRERVAAIFYEELARSKMVIQGDVESLIAKNKAYSYGAVVDKVCRRCHLPKAAAAFRLIRKPNRLPYLYHWCKDCESEVYSIRWRTDALYKERARRRSHNWAKKNCDKQDYKSRRKSQAAAYRERNREKLRERARVYYASLKLDRSKQHVGDKLVNR